MIHRLGLFVATLGLLFVGFQIWISDDFQAWLHGQPTQAAAPITVEPVPGTQPISEQPRASISAGTTESPEATRPAAEEVRSDPRLISEPEPHQAPSPRRDRFDLDRTDVFFRFVPAGSTEEPQLYLSFRNNSDRPLEYRMRSAYLTIDGIPLQVSYSRTRWVTIASAADLGPLMSIRNDNIMLAIGSVIEVSYEIDIRQSSSSPIERRYEKVRKTVVAMDSTVRTSAEQQIMYRTVMLPPE